MREVLVVSPGGFSTLQDRGRVGRRHQAVPRSGALDQRSLALANRLVGNHGDLAAIECLSGGLHIQAQGDLVVAVTGAVSPVTRGIAPEGRNVALVLDDGEHLRLGQATAGRCAYVAVRGGVAVVPSLGSRSYDQLSELGPRPLARGDVLPIGPAIGTRAPWFEPVPVRDPTDPVELRVSLGPRAEWLVDPDALFAPTWTVQSTRNRIGLRLDGPSLRRRPEEALSEPTVPGVVQLPGDGLPIILGPDCGATGGYPAVAVVLRADLDLAGQVPIGGRIRFVRRRNWLAPERSETVRPSITPSVGKRNP